MKKGISLRKKDGTFTNGYITYLRKEYIDKIMNLQDNIIEGIVDKQLYSPSSKEEFEECFSEKGKVIGCILEDDSLVAMAVYRNYHYNKHNYGWDINLEGEELLKTAQIESTLVLDEFRGNGLQKIMCLELENFAKEKGMNRIAATASPYNMFSVNNFKNLCYDIKADKLKYGGLRRYVLVKELKDELF